MKTVFRLLPLLLILSLAFGLLLLPAAAADYTATTQIEEVCSSVAYTGEYYAVSTPADEKNTLYVEGKTSTAVKMLCIELRKSATDDTNGTCVIRAFAVPDSTGAFSLKIDTTAGSYAAPEAVNDVGTAMTAKNSYDTMPGYLPVPEMAAGLYRLTITGATTDDDAAIGSGSQWWTGPLGGGSGYLWKGAVLSVSGSDNDPRLVRFDAVLSARSAQHAAVEGAASDVIDSYPGSWERYLDPDISDIEYVLEDPATGDTAYLTEDQVAYIAAVAQEITVGVSDNYTRLLRLYEYVSANFYYDHYALDAGASIQYCNPYYNLYALRTGYSVPNSSDGRIATVCDGYSAMIIAMARSLGIPARMVNGYSLSGSAYNATWATKTPGTSSNHWWVEAYVGGRWVMLDATRGSMNSWTRSSADDAGTWSKNSLISYAGFDISPEVISGSYLVREVEGGAGEGKYLCYKDEVSKLRAFLNTADDSGATNGSKLSENYDADDISTWFTLGDAALYTDGYGRVHEIIAGRKTLVGDADFSGLTSLEYLTIFTNDLTSLRLEGCSDLVYLSAGYNNFTSFDSTDSPALASLHLPSTPLQSAAFCHGSSVITITGDGGTFSFNYDAEYEAPLTIYAGTAPEGMVFRGIYDSSGALVTDMSGDSFLPEDTSYTVLFEDNTDERLPAPVVTADNDPWSGNIRLTWDAVEGADSYTVYRSASEDGSYTPWWTLNDSTYTSTSSLGEVFYFRVKANCTDDDTKSSVSSNIVRGVRILGRPSLSTTVDDATGKITLNWNAVANASGYDIYRSESETEGYSLIDSLSPASAETALSYTDESGAAGTIYYYKVVSTHADSSLDSADSNIGWQRCKCARPVVTGSVNADGKPTLTWPPVDGAEKYAVYRAENESDSVAWHASATDGSYTDTSAAAGTTYCYTVRAIAGESYSAHSEKISLTATDMVDNENRISAPVVTAGNSPWSGAIRLTWEAVEGADKYTVYRSAAETGTYSAWHTLTGTTYTSSTLSLGETYYYKVRAICADDDAKSSVYSDVIRGTQVLGRTSLTTAVDDASGKIVLSWTAVNNAAGYDIFRSTAQDGEYSLIQSVTELTHTDESGAAGTTYYYKVVATHADSALNSADSNIGWQVCKCARPVVTGSTNAGGKPSLTWPLVDGAEKYAVYRAENATDTPTWYASATDGSYTDKSAIAGSTYYYTVRAIIGESYSAHSEKIAVTCAQPPAVVAPVIRISCDAATGKPVLTWDEVPGAAKYEVWRAYSKNGTYYKMGTTSTLSYTNTGAEAGTTYYYKVRSLGEDGSSSDYSTPKNMTCDCAQPVVSISCVVSSGKPRLSWTAVDGAVKYEVWRAYSKNGTYYKMGTTTSTAYTNTGAKAGTTYYYKVYAIGTSSYSKSAASVVKNMTCDCAQPVVSISCVASSGKPRLSWTAVDGAVKYEVWRAYSKNGTYYKMGTTTNTSYTNTGATANTTYYYKVYAIGTSSYSKSAASTVKNMTCDCARPTVTLSLNANGKPRLSWSAVSGAVKYEVWRAYSETGTYYKMGTTTSTAYTNTGAVSGTTYYYKVYACGSSSYAKSAASSIVSAQSK